MSETVVVFSGGLDLQSPNIAAPKGTLRDCLNFEVGTQGGYARIGGHMPYDGTVMGPNVVDFLYFAVPALTWNSVDFLYGERVLLDITSGDFVGTQQTAANCIGWVAPFGGSDGTLILAFTPSGYSTAFHLSACAVELAEGVTSGALVTSVGGIALRKASDGLLTPQNYSSYRSNIETRHVAAIDAVPGDAVACCDAAFTYKDKNYAVHDCIAFYFKNGALGEVTEGHVLKIAGVVFGTVLSVTVSAGDWSAGTASGYVVMYSDTPGTVFPADGTNITLFNAAGLVSIGTVFQYDGVSDRSLLRSKTRAVLYVSNEQAAASSKEATPWDRVRLSREIGYTQIGATGSIGFGPQGDNPFSIYEYSRLGLTDQNAQLQPVTTDYKFCNTATQQAAVWSNLNNIKAQDGAVANTAATSSYTTWIKATNFDFSEIPVGSVITGLEVVIRRRATASATSTKDWSVQLVLPDGTITGEKADRSTFYPTALTDATYGGTTDTWGVQLSRDMLNNGAFGIYFNAIRSVAQVVEVDDIKVRVTYVPATRLVYIRNATAAAPTDIEARVVHYTRDSGQATTADQVGVLTLWIGAAEYQGTNAGKSRRIGIGEEIRTASGGGGVLLAKTTGEDYPTTLPCGAAVDAKNAKWEIKLANYYADPDAQMAFAVNGTEYGFVYDEQYSVRVRTGRRQDLDTPRHIEHHLNYVHWGFDSGDVITSATFRPLTVDPFLDSQVKNVGEPITGLAVMNGQTLGVWTSRAVRGYQGSSPLNYVPIVISPAIGAIEYTVTNLAGTPMWTSARGVESAATVSAYGDFQTDPLSFLASPWLQERVQFDSRIGLIDKRPVMAMAVRSKRQYRIYFRDGYVFTVTLFGIEDTPMCTIQRLERGGAASPYNYAPVRHVFAGIRDDGRENLLCCFERQNQIITGNENNDGAYPYLSILDSGKSFAGSIIPAYVETNPIYATVPSQEQKWESSVLWSNAMPLTGYTLYTRQTHDEPMQGPGSVGSVQPNATVMQLPIPNYACTFNIGRSGPFIRMRYDMNTGGSQESVRMTHMTISAAQPANIKRA
jgi:hypothetical protein